MISRCCNPQNNDTHLSTPVFVTERVSPIQKAEPATGCYLKAVPC